MATVAKSKTQKIQKNPPPIGKKSINPVLIVEAAWRERKYFQVYQEFTPNPKAESITPKFYARHEAVIGGAPQEYVDLCKRYESSIPRDRVTYPETENQRYGWYSTPFSYTRNNKRLNFPSKCPPELKLVAEIKKHLRKEKPFEGIPFKI